MTISPQIAAQKKHDHRGHKIRSEHGNLSKITRPQIGNATRHQFGAQHLRPWTMSTLTGYLRDGRFEIDNNLVENAIRPTKLGAKNWLFIGSREAGTHSAIIYTLIESARNRGLEPYAYLKELLTRLPAMTNHQIKDVTPRAWSEAQRQTQRTGS